MYLITPSTLINFSHWESFHNFKSHGLAELSWPGNWRRVVIQLRQGGSDRYRWVSTTWVSRNGEHCVVWLRQGGSDRHTRWVSRTWVSWSRCRRGPHYQCRKSDGEHCVVGFNVVGSMMSVLSWSRCRRGPHYQCRKPHLSLQQADGWSHEI